MVIDSSPVEYKNLHIPWILNIWPNFSAAPRILVSLLTSRSMLAGVKKEGDSLDAVPRPTDRLTVSEIAPIPKEAASPIK